MNRLTQELTFSKNSAVSQKISAPPTLSRDDALKYEQIACPFCGSDQAYAFRRSADIVRCAGCSTVYLRTRFKKQILEQIYQTYADEGSHMRLPKSIEDAAGSGLKRDYFLEEILHFTKPEGRLLDVGCGWGAFLLNGRERGFKPAGVELTRKAVEYANKRLGIPVVNTQFLDTPYEPDSFQVVTMNHVLEHLTEPRAALDKIYGILKPGGLFCGIVPNMDSFCATTLEEKWYWLDPNYHYVHYTPSTLRRHLEAAGFHLERLYTVTGDYGPDSVRKAALQGNPELLDDAKFRDWLKHVELVGQGEELRFFARKPLGTGCELPADVDKREPARACSNLFESSESSESSPLDATLAPRKSEGTVHADFPARDTGEVAGKSCWCGGPLKASAHPLYGTCVRCGTLVLKSAPTPNELKEYYSLQGYWHEHQKRDCGFPDIEQRSEADLHDRIPVWHDLLIQARARIATLLEIGCAHGGFLHYCRQRGVPTVVGVEVDEETCRFARSRFKLDHVQAGLFPDVELPCDQFDAITGFDVIEHLSDPLAGLKSVANLLSPQGVFLFQTPCYRGETGKWTQFKPAEHLFLYNDSNVQRLFARAGLQVTHILPGYFPDDMFVVGRLKTSERRTISPIRPPSAMTARFVDRPPHYIQTARISDPDHACALDEQTDLVPMNEETSVSSENRCASQISTNNRNTFERILFVRTDSVGDAVLASSMLEPIRGRFPNARIAVLCQQHVAELFTACPWIECVICYDRAVMNRAAERQQLLQEITGFRPDVILNSVRSRDNFSNELTQMFRDARHIAIEGDRDNISEADHRKSLSGYELILPTQGERKPELARHRDFLRGLGIEANNLQPVVWTTSADEELADAYFQQEKLDPQRTLALFPFTQHEVKDYPGFAEALQTFADWNILVFGGSETQERCAQLASRLPCNVLNLAGRTTLREAAALIRRCRILVGSDTCGAHIACAVGVPNVVVLGGGHFGRFLPYSPLTSAVALPLNCFGCNWRCSHVRAHCIKDVTPEFLLRAIRQTLDKPSSRPRIFLQPATSYRGGAVLPSWQRSGPQFDGIDAEIIEIADSSFDLATPASEKLAAQDDFEIVGDGIADPLVTIVVSAYKSEKFIGACLENLSHQMIFDRCEVIVVDSGSPENERAVVARFQERFPNIRYVRTPRETLYGAWNRGLALARGRYWANLNTDDSLRNDALEIFAGALDKNSDCALAYADTAWTAKPNDTFPSANIVKTVKYPDYAPLETLFYCITGCVQFFRTECLRQLGGFDATLQCAGDYEATLKIMAARKNAVHVPEVLSLFYQNTSGLTQASNRAALEHDQVMNQYRERLDVGNIFQVEPGQVKTVANALAALGVRASRFSVPWEDAPMAHNDFAIACLSEALNRDPENVAAGMGLVALNSTLQRLNSAEVELVRRWPRMRTWIDRFRAGDSAQAAPVKHTLLGPLYRPSEWSLRPTVEQLAHEPKTLRPWICRIDGRHVYLSEDLFPRPSGLAYAPAELQQAAKRLVGLLADLPPFYAHFGGAGDALLLLASFYDKNPEGVIFSYPNSVGGTRALFEAFPKPTKIYFLPKHTEFFFHMVLRYAVYELKNCLGAGTTPRDGYEDEWKASLDIEKKYRINKTPRWAAALRQNEQSRRVALAPKGSLSGMIGSKRNIIPPEDWSQIISYILERGFEPVILGVPSEAREYPAMPGCVDARAESFTGQMKLIGQCAGVVGADSWAKTFSAFAGIPTIVFEPLKGVDLCAWKDASDWVFIEPWPAIKMVKSLEEFRSTFDSRIARTKQPIATQKPMIAWEGSFLDHGSLSHINRELTARLTGKVDLTCIGRNGLPSAIQSDSALQTFAEKLLPEPPRNVAVTVRHQWPPKWSRPASGALVVIQPWEFGALPKAWVEASSSVDEFWVPSALVRAMYLNSGIAPEKVRVFANGVDSRKFRPGLKPMTLATKKKFKFLFVGGTIFRKGPDVLLAAFCDAFSAADDVCLVIKDFGGDSFYTGQTAHDAIRQAQEKPNAPEILHLKQELTAAQMPSLYAACDCLVLPYRGEGFGMPVLEAMACGLPVIVTAGGATDSFVSPEAGWKIASQGRRLGCLVGEMELVKEGWLLEPSQSHLTAILKLAVQHPEECRRRGACGRQTVERRFDWDDIAAAVAHRLNELGERALASGQILSNPAKPASNEAAASHLNSAPPVAKIGDLDQARAAFAAKDFQSAWKEASSAILQRPAHPYAFLLLAETAATFGEAALVHSCLQHARKLAPGRKPARPVVRKASQKTPEWMVSPESCVRASTPDKRRAARLTVCVIARNEQQNLARCLSSVKDLASQIVVVDTGSTDRTIEIARSLGAEVYEFGWCDDFSAARNAALEHARGDWVLILDADEELPPDQHARLRSDLENDKVIALRLPLVNEGQEAEGRTCVPRLFRNAPGVYFSGRIHEQVFTSLVALGKEWDLGTAVGAAQILHHGYTKEAVKDRNKVERNLKLLRLAVEESPNDLNLAMNLGLELVRSGDLNNGLVHYRRAFELMTSRPASEISPELREALLTQFTSHLYKVRAHKEVVEILTSAGGKAPGLAASLHFALGLACFELGRYGDSAEQMRQCLAKRRQSTLSPINTDILTAAPYHCLALSLAKAGDLAAAEKAFQTGLDEKGHGEEIRLDYARFLGENNRAVDAVHKLHEIVVANPKCIRAWRDGGQLALRQSEFLEFACDWTSEAIQQFPEDDTIMAQRAEALFLSQQIVQALPLWQMLVKRSPQPRSQAALIFCELLEHGAVTSGDVYEAELGPIGRALVEWYQRCLSMRTRTVVNLLNERLAGLRSVLPAAADMIEAALSEARSESGAAVEPCLV